MKASLILLTLGVFYLVGTYGTPLRREKKEIDGDIELEDLGINEAELEGVLKVINKIKEDESKMAERPRKNVSNVSARSSRQSANLNNEQESEVSRGG